MRRMRRRNPTVFNTCTYFGLIGEPVTDSIPTKSSLPPSSAGNGRRFMTARLSEINAVNIRSYYKTYEAVCFFV